jgi:hypothetical protein
MLYTTATANILQAPKGRWMFAPMRVAFKQNAYRRRQGSV